MKKSNRKSFSKKDRFEIFKRDNFTCQYCSIKAPNAVLEIDHIIPICKGGKNDLNNLTTACFDCNRGKSGNELNYKIEEINRKIIIFKYGLKYKGVLYGWKDKKLYKLPYAKDNRSYSIKLVPFTFLKVQQFAIYNETK